MAVTGRVGLGAVAHPRRSVTLESSGSASFIGCRRIEREALRPSWRGRRSGNGPGMAGQFGNGRADCRGDFADRATLAFPWTGLGRCATGKRRKAGTGARERRPTGLRAQPKRGCHRKHRGRWQQGLYGQGKGCNTGTGARTALRRRACAKERGGWRAEPLHAATLYTQSSWSSKPKRADALRDDQQAGGAARLDTIRKCLKPC